MVTKSQIKMGETIAILIIFFFLVVFGFSFYVRIQQTTFGRQERENVNLRAIQIAQRASFLPELQCSFKNVGVDNCFDLIKLNSFSILLNDSEEFYSYYYDVFGFSEIKIQEIYPGTNEYPLYLNPPTGTRPEYNLSTLVPVSLYNATAKTYSFGLLRVNVYS